MVVAVVAAEDAAVEPAVARTVAESAERPTAMRLRVGVVGAAVVDVAAGAVEVVVAVVFLRGEQLDRLRWIWGWSFGEGTFALIPVYFYGRNVILSFRLMQ